jgi:hypothetical protein
MNFIYLIVLTAFLACSTVVYSLYSKQNSLINKIAARLPILTAFLVSLCIFITYKIFQRSTAKDNAQITLQLNDKYQIQLYKEYMNLYDKIPNFIDSLFYPWQMNIYKEGIEYHQPNPKEWTSRHYLAIYIFQCWSDILQMKQQDKTPAYEWIATFLPCCQSKPLKQLWIMMRGKYFDYVMDFGDMMFEISEKTQINNAEELHALAVKIEKSERFQKIIEKANTVSDIFTSNG